MQTLASTLPSTPGTADSLVVSRQRLSDADLSGRQLSRFCAIESRFERCSFRGAFIDEVQWGSGRRQSVYVDCCFDDTRLRDISAGNARFVRCSFRDVHIELLRGHHAEFVDCTFSGRIDSGFLNGTRDPLTLGLVERLFSRRTNEIAGNDFSECVLKDFDFRTGVDLSRQRLPAGPDYLLLPEAGAAIRAGTAAVETWRDDEVRRLATLLLDLMSRELARGQRSQFVCLPAYGDFAEPWRRLRQAMARHDA